MPRQIARLFVSTALLSLLISGCSYNRQNEPVQQSSESPNASALVRQFENDIARTLALRAEQITTTSIFSKQDLTKQLKDLDYTLQQFLKLDTTLLASTYTPLLHRLRMRRISLRQQLNNWEQRNHIAELLRLIPPQSFAFHSSEKIQKIKYQTLQIPEVLTTLKQDINGYSTKGGKYSSSNVYFCEILGQKDDNLILERFQQILLYSDLDVHEQKNDYQSFKSSVNEHVIPAIISFCSFLQIESNDISYRDEFKKISNTPSFANEDSRLALTNAITQIDNKLIELNPLSSLRELYDRHVKATSNQEQISLDRLTQIVADLHYGLERWFTKPLNREVLIAASDQIEPSPFYFTFNTAFFDLALISALPVFELETLAYQYTIPGIHMLAYNTAEQEDPLWRAYASAWSIYALSLPTQPDYYTHSLSRIAAHSRKKFAMIKALTDLNLSENNWSIDQAKSYLYDNSPYPIELIDREIINLVSSPNEAMNAWMISEELEKLWRIDHSLTRAEFNDRLLNYAPANLDFLENEMPKILLGK